MYLQMCKNDETNWRLNRLAFTYYALVRIISLSHITRTYKSTKSETDRSGLAAYHYNQPTFVCLKVVWSKPHTVLGFDGSWYLKTIVISQLVGSSSCRDDLKIN